MRFEGEAGQDLGGVRREFFTCFAECLSAPPPDNPLFMYGEDNTLTPIPMPNGLAPGVRDHYVAVGRFLGLCLMQGHTVGLQLNRALYKLMVGRPVTVSDVSTVDPEFFRNSFGILMQRGGVEMMEQVWPCGRCRGMARGQGCASCAACGTGDGGWAGMHWKGGSPPPPPPGRLAYAQRLPPRQQVPASVAFVTDSNCPQPLWQPPPTAYPTAPGAASEAPPLLMHPWGWVGGV